MRLPFYVLTTYNPQNHQYWDHTVTGNSITPSRTAILDTIPKVIKGELKAKSSISAISKFFFNIKHGLTHHRLLSIAIFILVLVACTMFNRRRRGLRGGFLHLDEKDALSGGLGMSMGSVNMPSVGNFLGGNRSGFGSGGKVD